jgi:hypothetical protein
VEGVGSQDDQAGFSGIIKVMFCQRLRGSWLDLSDVLGIAPHERGRFPPGDEARVIWEWLAARRRLKALPAALAVVDRTDLQQLLETLPAQDQERVAASKRSATSPSRTPHRGHGRLRHSR